MNDGIMMDPKAPWRRVALLSLHAAALAVVGLGPLETRLAAALGALIAALEAELNLPPSRPSRSERRNQTRIHVDGEPTQG